MKKIKKIIPFALIVSLVLPFVGCTQKFDPIDYSDDSNWVKIEKSGTKDVDVFFVTPTITEDSLDDSINEGNFGTIDEIRDYATNVIYTYMTAVYADSTNVYMPLYRQATMGLAYSCNFDNTTYLNKLYNNVPYQDVASALDYYFEHYNNNKPFILAGHSQGSAIVTNLLMHYMQEHPNYLTRMVAAYTIGFAPSEEMFETYKNLSFATGETDTGVVVSWTTEGPNAQGKSILLPEHPMVINPITWTTDTSYGSTTDVNNLGTRIGEKADARINPVRKTVVCTTSTEWSEAPKAFSTQSLHGYDYFLYYNNLKDNVAKRINAFLN